MTPMKISDENLYYGSLYMRFDEVRLQRQQVRCTRPLLHIRKMCVCVVAVLFASISAFGLTATVDGIKWTYTVSNGKASVGEGTSSTPAVSTSTSGAITIPSSLGGYSVTSIGDYAFCGCSGLMSVTIPDSVTSIGREAFSDCSELANVVIGSGVTSIGNYAFEYCRKLKSVEFKGNAPPYCYNSVFYGIASGCEVIVPRNSTGWGVREGELWHGLVLRYASNVKWEIVNGELRGVELNGETAIIIPSSVTSIGDSAFYNCSGLTNVVIGSGVITIGNDAFHGCRGLTSITIPDSVTRIGDYAFCYCRDLTSITIPASVTSIGAWAFAECNWVIELHISDLAAWCKSLPDAVVMNPHGGANLYLNGNLITALTIPASVTSIKSYAFYCCNGFTSVTIPDSVTSIGSFAFSHCHDLTSVKIGNGVKSIGDAVFQYCGRPLEISVSEGNEKFQSVNGLILTKDGKTLIQGVNVNGDVTIPDSVTSIGSSAFCGCSGLSSMTIPDGVTSIGSSAFYNCSGLMSVTIPDSVTSIGDSAFKGCSGLKAVTVSQYVLDRQIGSVFFSALSSITNVSYSSVITNIRSSAFEGCSGLMSVTIPDSVTSIGNSAFEGCNRLRAVTIPDSVTNIGDDAFKGCSGLMSITVDSGNANYKSVNGLLLSKDGKTLIQGVNGDVTIPDSVTGIWDSAFEGCSGLSSMTIPDGVTSIGDSVFYNCSGLTNMVIGSGVTSIGNSAFAGCSGLASVTIPDSVTSIGDSAFYNCSGLASVVIDSGVTHIGDDAFSWCDGLTNMVIGSGVTSIGDDAFLNCSGLASVTIPDSVTSIGDSVFYNCSDLTSVTFLGDAPAVDSYTFYGVNASCVALVSPKSTGWGVGVGEKWKGLTLQYWPEILTVASSDTEVGAIVATFADKGFAAQVTNKVEYDAFRAWVNGNNLYQPNVVKSTRTWLSYALGADALIGKEITSNDVRIVAFEATNADSGAMGSSHPTSFAFEVATDGVNIGGGMVAVETLKENLKKVLDVEGATTLSLDAFSSDNIEITFDTPVDGKARLTVSPPADASSSFFLRVKVK